MRLFACFLALVWLAPGLALAQVDLVDPDAKRPPPKRAVQPVTDDTVDIAEPPEDPGDGTLVAPPTGKKAAPKTAKELARELAAQPPKKEPPPRREPPPVVVKTISDADLNAAWSRWAAANASKNQNAELVARKELLALRDLIGSTNAELWSIGMLRAAQAWETAGDSGAAVEIAVSAAELAPDLPATWFLLARLYFTSDPSGIGRYVGAVQKGLAAQLADPRYARPLIADVATIFLVALIGTAIAVVLVLLLRRGFYFLYDFHFLFPRAAARWQTGALAVMLLLLPIVFRMGVVPTLLAFFAAVTLYLSVSERVVAAVLISLLGFVPLLGATVVEKTAFADTVAEDLYRIERGGPGIEPLVQRYEKLAAEDKVGFAERFVLGHFHLNRGHLEQAITHLKGSLALRPDDVPARVALAKAFFLQGDLENSRSVLEKVKAESPSAIALLDLSRVYQRRVQVYGDAAAGEIGKASQYLMEARQLDPSLPAIASEDPLIKEIIGNSHLRSLPLAQADLLELARGEEGGKRVRSQLSQILVGDVPSALALLYPLIVSLLLVGFGFLSKSIEAARVCTRCGRPVSHRGDPDVSPGSSMCTQCVNVFARKNVVAPSVKVRKQLEVARYENQMERASTFFGVLWSGMGHVFSGDAVRGALYGYFFVLAISGAVFRAGVVRPPFDGLPMVLRMTPLVLLFLVVYPLSLLRLRRKQG